MIDVFATKIERIGGLLLELLRTIDSMREKHGRGGHGVSPMQGVVVSRHYFIIFAITQQMNRI